jgi:hypothetical protein
VFFSYLIDLVVSSSFLDRSIGTDYWIIFYAEQSPLAGDWASSSRQMAEFCVSWLPNSMSAYSCLELSDPKLSTTFKAAAYSQSLIINILYIKIILVLYKFSL